MKNKKKTTRKPRPVAKKAAAKKPRARKMPAKKTRNRTVIKAKRVTVLSANPKRKQSKKRKPAQTKRVKVGNGYVHLAIAGQAKSDTRSGQKGWVVGRKFFPVGSGTKKLTGGQTYLDLGTGYVYRKTKPNGNQTRRRNLDHRDGEHPIAVTHHWRQGPPGYMTKWQRARAAGQKDLFDIKNPKRKGSKKTKRRNSDHGGATKQAKQQFKEFHGYPAKGTLDLMRPDSAPASGLSVLGKLHLIKLDGGGEFQAQGKAYLCRDTRGRLHICCERGCNVYDAPAGLLGTVKQVEYETRKPHLGHPRQTIFFHRLGEEGGKKPKLHSDGKGGLVFKGGDYFITPEGIRN